MRLGHRIATLERTMPEAFGRWLRTLTDAELDALIARYPPTALDLSTVSDADFERLAAGEAPAVVLGSDYATRYQKR